MSKPPLIPELSTQRKVIYKYITKYTHTPRACAHERETEYSKKYRPADHRKATEPPARSTGQKKYPHPPKKLRTPFPSSAHKSSTAPYRQSRS